MKFIDFPYRNMMLGAPPEMEDTCGALPVWSNGKCFVSVCELDDEDIERIKRDRQIFLIVYGGAHPPVSVESENPLKEEFKFTIGDHIYCKVESNGQLVEVSGIITMIAGTYMIKTGKETIPMAFAREVTIVHK